MTTPRPFPPAAANDHLSRAASQISLILRQTHESYAEIREMFAPMECGGLVAAAARRQIQEVLDFYQMTPQDFYNRLVERTSPNAVYRSGLDISQFLSD